VPPPSFTTSGQDIALATGSPLASSLTPILAANSQIAAATGNGSDVLGIEEVGSGYSVGGAGSQTATSTTDFGVTVTSQDLAQDLVVGVYGGTSFGSGVTAVSLDVYANGNDLLSASFTSGSAAAAYFTNNTIDLGALSGSSLDLKVQMQVTSTSAGSGFYGGILFNG
jgi:hypothetical protein